ncbi:hypothetical protein RF11_04230 [Thelohanellus kitauei]|uniref:Cystatin domain-containing protein n=1 Tax=Thelohanellus kitauei TaxID=669202 RepID=A0A0C2MYA1_THEKT|nr:hypothetical protein RF11_04230 [Thelohanellus kitauei]
MVIFILCLVFISSHQQVHIAKNSLTYPTYQEFRMYDSVRQLIKDGKIDVKPEFKQYVSALEKTESLTAQSNYLIGTTYVFRIKTSDCCYPLLYMKVYQSLLLFAKTELVYLGVDPVTY